MQDRLTSFQRELLENFSELAPEFFLTGGAALVGFHLGHRTTHDLDFFVTDNLLDQGTEVLREVAKRQGARLESLRTSPSFRRFLVRGPTESVVVDLVHDPTPQGQPKQVIGNVRLDTPAEILANKLCSLLSRSEIRDLVDVMALESAGNGIPEALELAMRKDSGLTPGQLAWVLSSFAIGDDATIPGKWSAEEVRAYLADLRSRLERLALPE